MIASPTSGDGLKASLRRAAIATRRLMSANARGKPPKCILFSNNCPIREHTADGVNVGRCWHWLTNEICPRHGNVRIARQYYIETGELTNDTEIGRN